MKIGSYDIRPFVVVLQEMPEKTAFIQNHFKERGLGEVECFSGLNADVSGVQTKWTYELDNPGGGWNIGPRPVANWLSFWALWNALSFMPESHFLVCEWDANFAPDWKPRAEEAMRCVPPDFDLLLWGSCCAQGKASTPICGNVYDIRYPHCGHATVVAKKALPVMLKTQRKLYAPMDLSLMMHTFSLLKVYTVLPTLATQFDTVLHP